MAYFRDQAMQKLDENNDELQALRGKLSMIRAVLNIAAHPLWEEYSKGLRNLAESKAETMLSVDIYEKDTDLADKVKTMLGAEIRLLRYMVQAPDKMVQEEKVLEARIGKLSTEVDKLSKLYSKGERNGR